MMGSILNQPFKEKLSDEQLKELFEKYHAGDNEAFNKIIEHNVILVLLVIKNKFSNSNMPLDDLFSTGSLALIKAVRTFDENKKIKFETYASVVIRNEILMTIRKESKHKIVSSYNVKVGYEKTEEIIELLESDDNTEEEFLESELITLAKDFISFETNNVSSILSESEKVVLNYLYGLNGYPKKNQNEIGLLLGVTQSRISRLASGALKKIRKKITSYGYLINEKRTKKVIEKSMQSFYEIFPNNSKEEIDEVINLKLSKKERDIILDRFGNNLEKPGEPIQWSSEKDKLYFSVILPKIQRNLMYHEKNTKSEVVSSYIYDILKPFSKDSINEAIKRLPEENQVLLKSFYGDDFSLPCVIEETKKEQLKMITRKLLEELKKQVSNTKSKRIVVKLSQNFEKKVEEPKEITKPKEDKEATDFNLNEVIQSLPFNEAMIISLSLGISSSKKYPVEQIAKILKLDEEYVKTIISNFINKYQIDKINENTEISKNSK